MENKDKSEKIGNYQYLVANRGGLDFLLELLTKYKGNLRRTWTILKQVINKRRYSKVQTEFKLSDGSTTKDKSIISESFNDFFVNIGPNLANKIPNQTKRPESYLGERNRFSIHLTKLEACRSCCINRNLQPGAMQYRENQ